MKLLARPAIIASIVLIAALAVRPIILGGSRVVTLRSAPALSGQISQAFTTDTSQSLPRLAKDFTIKNVAYFQNGQWAITNITALNDKTNDSIVVFKKQSGMYTAAIGPGTAFPSTQVDGLPADVAAYMHNSGFVYEPVF